MVGDGAKGRAVGVGRGSQMLRGPKVVVPATFDPKVVVPATFGPRKFRVKSCGARNFRPPPPKVVVPATFDRKLWCPQLLTPTPKSCGARWMKKTYLLDVGERAGPSGVIEVGGEVGS